MKKANNREMDKMVGTVNNQLKKMSPKQRSERRTRALRNMTESEKQILIKWGIWNDFRLGNVK